MHSDPSKVQALQDLPTLTTRQIFNFLGLLNYLQAFLPGLAPKTTFMREQVTHWDWNPSTDVAFHRFKSWICNTLLKTTLPYYDHKKPVLIKTDASEYVLGTALIQNGRPIAFMSKTIKDVKTRSVNIKRECLSVCFRLGEFHTYIYVCHFIIQNEHKPLEMIQKKPIHTAAPQLQCMFHQLQKYDCTM